jgi:hypothetical protein
LSGGGTGVSVGGGSGVSVGGGTDVLGTGGTDVLGSGGTDVLGTGGTDVLGTGGTDVLGTGGTSVLVNVREIINKLAEQCPLPSRRTRILTATPSFKSCRCPPSTTVFFGPTNTSLTPVSVSI